MVALTSIAGHGVAHRIGGEGVVGGTRTHILFKALGDSPVGPGIQYTHRPLAPLVTTTTSQEL